MALCVSGLTTVMGATVPAAAVPVDPLSTWIVARRGLDAHGLAYNAVSDRYLVTVGSAEGAPLGNSLVEIDPVSGEAGRHVFVGSEPSVVAVSDDGTTAWVGFRTTNALVKVDLVAFQVTGLAMLEQSPWATVAAEIEFQPGSNEVFAVSVHYPCCSPSLAGLAVFDDGVQRGPMTSNHTGASTFAWSDDPGKIYGYNNQHTGFEFFEIAVTPDGPVQSDEMRGLLSGFFRSIEGADGLIYGSNGQVLDPSVPRRLGTFSQASGAHEIDAGNGFAYFLGDGRLRRYDASTFLLADERVSSSFDGYWDELVASPHGIAAIGVDLNRDASRLVIAGPDVGEQSPPELGLFAASSSTNLGPGVAVRWRARDDSGVAGFDVSVSDAPYGYRFSTWKVLYQNTPKQSLNLKPPVGTTRCVRFRARDALGNLSAWSPIPVCVTTPQRMRNMVVAGRWYALRQPRAFGGEIIVPDSPTARAGQRIRARSVALVVTRCPNCGKVKVFLDGVVIGQVDTRWPKLEHRVVIPVKTFGRLRTGIVTVRPSSASALLGLEGFLAPTPLE